MPDLLRAFIRGVAWFVPGAARREFRDEWSAELATDPSPRRAIGALADAWYLIRQAWSAGSLLHDVRYAVRLLVRYRGLTLASTITLALAIGANTAVFSVLQAAMLRPIPVRDPDRMVVAWQTAQNGTRLNGVFSYPDYRDWRSAAHAVERMALITWSTAIVTGSGDAERLQAAAITSGFFQTLGVPVDGRVFEPGDEAAGAERVVIVSEHFRRRHLAVVPQALGALVTVNGTPRRVVGVLPADPLDGVFGAASDVWLPIQQRPQLEGRGNRNFTAIARLAGGARLEHAQQELAAVMARLEREYPQTNKGRGARVIGLRDQLSGASRHGLLLAAAASSLLLIVACANVAGLLIARGLTRSQEFATRAALGASRSRLVRQLAIEALVLAAAGSAAGVALFLVAAPALVRLLPASVPRASTIGWDPRLLAFGAAAAGLAALLASVPAAWRIGRPLPSARRTAAGGGTRHVLAAAQIATASVLLIVAGLLGASLARLQRIDAGFPADRMMTLQIQLRGAAYDAPEKQIAFVDRLLASIGALPAVEHAAILDPAPFSGHINRWDATADSGVPVFKADRYLATATVFDVLGLRPVRGRLFGGGTPEPDAAVVDSVFAATAFPGIDPIGRTFKLDQNAPRRIVGIVPHIKHYGLDETPRPQAYVPFTSDPSDWLNLLVTTRIDAGGVIADIRQTIRAIDPDLAPYDATTVSALVWRSFGDRLLASALATALGVITLVVAGAGLYGTMDFLVARRAREIGVRLALGARPAGLVRLVLGSAGRVAAAGALAGLPFAILATRSIRALLYGTAPFDPGIYAAVIAVLALVTLVAAAVPARRAARVDPVTAIRTE